MKRQALIVALAASLLVGGTTDRAGWEYRIVSGPLPRLQKDVNELVAEGWEIVSVTHAPEPPGTADYAAVMKRRK